jgi:hypothetical protein
MMKILYIYADWETGKAYIVAQNWDLININQAVLEAADECFIIKLKPWGKQVDLPLKWMYDDNKYSAINIAERIFDED